MKATQEILREVEQLPARERAAAIAHYVYMKTAERVGWGRRVPTEWGQLPPDARDFNIASIDTWANEPDLYDAWRIAVQQLREGRESAEG
jgi:hypothetical protein